MKVFKTYLMSESTSNNVFGLDQWFPNLNTKKPPCPPPKQFCTEAGKRDRDNGVAGALEGMGPLRHFLGIFMEPLGLHRT